jgi:hypothetical protein
MRRFLHRFAVISRDAPGARHAVELVGDNVLGGEDRRDAGLASASAFSIAAISAWA